MRTNKQKITVLNTSSQTATTHLSDKQEMSQFRFCYAFNKEMQGNSGESPP